MGYIALDARKYLDFGIGTYIRHLIREYAMMNSPRPFLLFVPPDWNGAIDVPPQWKTSEVNYGKYSLSEMLLFGRTVKANDISVFHSPHYTLPFGIGRRSVVTIHDLIHIRFPQFFSPLQRTYSFGMILHAVRDAEYIITDSEFSKRDILRSFRTNEDKIVVIPLGVSDSFRRKPEASDMLSFRQRYGLERPYVIFVGNTKPHKGIDTLLRAFREVSTAHPDVDLTFVGGSLAQNPAISDLIIGYGLGGKVKSLGQLPDEELVLAYWGAEMLVLPSLYEGFGLPALEAMACHVPVIVSDAASLPEIVGNAAIVCETGKASAFADAMKSLLREPQLKREMIEKGETHVGNYSWRLTAQKTMDVYNKLL